MKRLTVRFTEKQIEVLSNQEEKSKSEVLRNLVNLLHNKPNLLSTTSEGTHAFGLEETHAEPGGLSEAHADFFNNEGGDYQTLRDLEDIIDTLVLRGAGEANTSSSDFHPEAILNVIEEETERLNTKMSQKSSIVDNNLANITADLVKIRKRISDLEDL